MKFSYTFLHAIMYTVVSALCMSADGALSIELKGVYIILRQRNVCEYIMS